MDAMGGGIASKRSPNLWFKMLDTHTLQMDPETKLRWI